MAKNPTTGRAILSAYGTMPTGPDDPRFMTIEDIEKALEEMTASADEPSQPRTLDDLAGSIWAKRNAPRASAGHSEQGDDDEARDSRKPAPQSLDDIRDAAWSKFNGKAR